MAMKNKKLILIISVIGLFVIGIAIGAGVVYLMTRTDSDISPPIYVEARVPVTEEQYQILRASILQIDDMNNIRRRNAWLMLEAMQEVEFIENVGQGQSRVGFATRIFELWEIGEIDELVVVRIDRGTHGFNDALVMRIKSMENNIYYITYDQNRGLGRITRDSEDGERIYSRALLTVVDGQFCQLEHLRGPIAFCK